MKLELFVFIQIVSGFMGFLLGRAARNHDRRCKADSDIRLYIPARCRGRGGDNRCVEQVDDEQVINGLQNLRMSLSQQEREYLDYACERVLKCSRLNKWIEESEEK